jgi:hypothetical protein
MWFCAPSHNETTTSTGGSISAGTHGNMGGSLQRCALLAGAVCAFVICVIGSRSSTNVAGTDELYLDDMKLANKILSQQKFTKANEQERTQVVKTLLKDGHKHKTSEAIVSKVAGIVANTGLSYTQRMEAMKKLLDEQTDKIKEKPITGKRGRKGPAHAGEKAVKSEAQVARDDKKAMSEGAKLLAERIHHVGADGHVLHAPSAHDKKVHEESEHKAADPAKATAWFKKQLSVAKSAKALKEGGALMALDKQKSLAKHKTKLKKAAKEDEAMKTTPESANSVKVTGKKLAAHKKLIKKSAHKQKSSPAKSLSSSQKLIKWAEKHGLPKKLANNPKDKMKVKDIIARMKADLMVEKIKAQFKHDDATVGHIIKGADPAAANSGI